MGLPGRPRTYHTDRPATVAERQTRWRQIQRHPRSRLKVYHRSQTVEWSTPPEIFTPLHAEFGFTLDVCAKPDNAKCVRYFTEAQDGLMQSWAGEICWMNPPYKETAKWIRKAYESAQAGATVVCLVKSTTDTAWWHDYAQPHSPGSSGRRSASEGEGHSRPDFPLIHDVQLSCQLKNNVNNIKALEFCHEIRWSLGAACNLGVF
jgi:phage N-6-adenine-methyltransferase